MCDEIDYTDRIWDISYALEAIAKEMHEANKLKRAELVLKYGEDKVYSAEN